MIGQVDLSLILEHIFVFLLILDLLLYLRLGQLGTTFEIPNSRSMILMDTEEVLLVCALFRLLLQVDILGIGLFVAGEAVRLQPNIVALLLLLGIDLSFGRGEGALERLLLESVLRSDLLDFGIFPGSKSELGLDVLEKFAGANLHIDDIHALQPHAPSLHRRLQVSRNGRRDQILVLDDVLDGVDRDDGSDNSLRTVDQFVADLGLSDIAEL